MARAPATIEAIQRDQRTRDRGWIGAAIMAILPFLTIIAIVFYFYRAQQNIQIGDSTPAGLIVRLLIAGLATSTCYLLPGILAWYRKKRRAGVILALDVTLGWTGIGWLALLVWALVGD